MDLSALPSLMDPSAVYGRLSCLPMCVTGSSRAKIFLMMET